jgi:chemotaxis protein methyltransferase CheR
MSDISAIVTPITDARISDEEFQAIRKLVYGAFGINLTEQKKTLVVGRLQKILKRRGFATFKEYFQWAKAETTGAALEELANNISTNHTFFFREKAHFEFFARNVLPELTAAKEKSGDRELRIWCAGCSSGEEPYTLMMLMMEHLGHNLPRWRPLLLATDLSAEILKTAMMGVYEEDRVEPMPPALRNKYFRRAPEGGLSVIESVRKNITYRRHNLMDATFPFKKPFDAIFCRNVMIYFDRVTRNTLVAKFHQHTAPGGHFFIGHSESLGRGETEYEYVMPAVYRRGI